MTRRSPVTAVLLAGRHYNVHCKRLLVSVHFFFFRTKFVSFMMMFSSEEKKHPRNRRHLNLTKVVMFNKQM